MGANEKNTKGGSIDSLREKLSTFFGYLRRYNVSIRGCEEEKGDGIDSHE